MQRLRPISACISNLKTCWTPALSGTKWLLQKMKFMHVLTCSNPSFAMFSHRTIGQRNSFQNEVSTRREREIEEASTREEKDVPAREVISAGVESHCHKDVDRSG